MARTRVAVIDYEVGNLCSVLNALRAVGGEPAVVREPATVAAFDVVLLPGVGAFGAGMNALHALGMIPALNAHVAQGKPLLGICLGMQLLCRSSEEYGVHQGLGWIDADVVRLPDTPAIKIPHVGWNDIHLMRSSPLLNEIDDGADVYFNHSFVVKCRDGADSLAETHHGTCFSSMVERDHVFGAQFHPEKSQAVGLKLLENFLRSA